MIPYQHISFEPKFYAEFEFQFKISFRPRIKEKILFEKFLI